jgi:hypothetical protein
LIDAPTCVGEVPDFVDIGLRAGCEAIAH